MSAQTVSSVEELSSFLTTCLKPRICVVHQASTDIVDAAVSCAVHHAEKGPVRIVCADRWSAAHVRDALRAHDASSSSVTPNGVTPHAPISVVWVRDLASAVLNDERLRNVTARSGRVLDANEMDVLMEDMKVSGVSPRRLREMVKFFFKGLADCATDDDHWLVNQEEHKVFTILTENLRARQAVIPEEASLRACEGLKAVPDAVETSYVVAVDYGAMSRASQRLVGKVSEGSLTAFCRDQAMACPDEDYPNFKGIAAMRDKEGTVTVKVTDGPSAKVAATHDFPTPFDEFEGTARDVVRSIENGTPAEEILIAVPNRLWGAKVGERLERSGVTSTMLTGDEKIPGDPRKDGSCSTLKLAAFAKLERDSHDICALRTWIGCGDWLMCSDAFLESLAYARDHDDCDVLTAFKQMRANVMDTKAFEKIADRLDELDALRTHLESIQTPEDVRTAFSKAGIELKRDSLAMLDETDLKSSLARMVHAALPAQARTAGAGVRIALYKQCHALFCTTVYVTGLVGGFLPKLDALDDAHTIDHKNKAFARDKLAFEDLVSRARDEAIPSSFDHDRLQNAEALHMDIARVYVKDGKRMARIAPCAYLATPHEKPAEEGDQR